jgi:hypothetical protein
MVYVIMKRGLSEEGAESDADSG